MKELRSHVSGAWVSGAGGKGRASLLVNPTTEEPIATASTEGVDFQGALAYARDVGGPALRALTFAQRGELARGVSRAIHAHRDELLALAVENGGNTRSDAKFDVDGASGTLAAYADLAQELGDHKVLPDGDGVQLARSPRLFGQHVRVPREGVAVHVNAFNFPGWGLAEKLAQSLVAGMPVISKPATSTALLAHRVAEIIVDENLLPPGAFSFVAGSAGDLLDHLGGQDVLAFTGSSTTGVTLRSGKAVIAHSVRVNVEADSLNAAVLGPDVDDESDVMDLFVTDVVRDMTQKAGQKCTAIRRVYVPEAKIEQVIERLRERLAAVKVGDPSREETGMGPVATAQQLRDVRDGVGKLSACAKIVFGSTDALAGAIPDKGYFVSPVLLFGREPDAGDAVHNHEVFGPVATVMAYDGTPARAAALVAAGGGGLVASVYSDDKDFLQRAVLGMATWNGRITLGTSKTAAQSIPPGTALPQLLHGGPGRAGGGEELGGLRGVAFYMQRVALQGDRALLDAIVGKR